ncbi:hypothetical protein SEA_LOZINAK_113 [Gordonia phage Lozinak]|uniref:Uncharacterized protein n=4 Tax=Smoothievirus TaxID=1982557 RepID=A0A2D1GFV6_9CAUD|nr:hypothetical protein BEN60_gp093 [Gordonia phage Smoothie]YP_009273149.1 hypothetical protein BH768_gp093 [Gordonia phage ClubL]YP_009276226.1 hypothetical protein BH772_gp096 [Gordonia phage Bachita]YP_009281268.1 hypothetical protein BIZ74_gp091 [Gordonia phage Cucurbita]ATN90739.1 hypothetical protein SEA_LOZINAK_113 [Gordonia phage Lozinak]AUE23688.1 hypothetical protein SEA_TONIANN_113 [Gordonia phage Toniann]QKY79690.1 hypothetical protein SEA_ENGINEER_114 [Gordonia Phage Engineer]W
MRVRSIELAENGFPEQVTVVMSRSEAEWITLVLGSLTGEQEEAIKPGYREQSGEIYNALVGELFNRFWEDGINDAVRGRDRR